MSSKRKKTTPSHSSQSGSENSDNNSKRARDDDSSSSSSDEGETKSRAGSGSDSAASGSGSRRSRKSNSSKSFDSGTEGSGKSASGKPSPRSSSGNSSSGSGKSKKLKKASSRKPSSKLEATALSHDSDSEEEQNLEKNENKNESPRQESRSSSDEETWKDNFGDGLNEMLIGDEDDKKRLDEMTEREREEELFRRAEKREELKKRFEITKKLEKQQKNSRKDEDREDGEIKDDNSDEDNKKDVPFNCRKKKYEEKYDKKFSALNELKAKREEKEKKDAKRKEKEIKKKPRDSESGSDLEKLARNQSSKKQVLKASDVYSSSSDDGKDEERRRSSSSSSSSSSVSSISSGESDTERHTSKKLVKKALTLETLDQLEQIRLSRHKIEKFVHLPIFKRTAVGCFVRIGIGNNPTDQQNKAVYRVAEIVEICETAKTYNVGKSKTNIGLKLRHGRDERVFRVAFVSNQPFTFSEFIKWKNECEKAHIELPNVQTIDTKANDINKALNYRFSSADVDKILASKGKFSVNPVNYAVHKTKLQKEKLQFQEMGNDKEAEKVAQQLLELEERAEELDKKRTNSISAVAGINLRNRKANILKAEKAIHEEMRHKLINGKDEDPFTRRKTAPKLPSAKKEEEEMTSELLLKLQQKKDEDEKKKGEYIEKKIPKAFETKLPKGLQSKPAFTNDLFDAHDFDVEINVSEIQENSNPASINLKPVTSNAKNNDGPTKTALKIDEWKKKRGII